MRLRALLVVFAVACASQPRPQPSVPVTVTGHHAATGNAAAAGDRPALDQDLPRLVERSLAMYEAVAKAFAASGEDCAGAADKLGQLASSYRDVVQANAKVLHDGRAKELRAALEPHGDAFDASARAIVQSATMSRCSQVPAFARAFDELLEAPP